MKLKHQYFVSVIGIVLSSYGSGWVMLSTFLGVPLISTVNAIGLIIAGLGLAIVIKTLSTINKIELIVEEEIDEEE